MQIAERLSWIDTANRRGAHGLRWCVWFVALAGSVACGASAEWRYTRTEHFEVLSAATEKETRQLVTELEQFRASFVDTFALRPAVEPRVTVVLFDSDKRFTPYKPTYKGKAKDVSGYFIGGEDEIFIAMNAGRDSNGGESAAETIFHEYVHLLLHTRGLRVPTWLNEGMAELFSTFVIEDGKVEYGRPKQSYVDVLNFSALMPLARLFAVNETSPDYNEEERAGLFYAQSWALTHFLVCGADRTNSAKLARFLEGSATSLAGPEAAFREAFGKDFQKLESDLRGYLQGGTYYKRRVPVPLADLANKLTIRAATELEQEMTLLNLRWRVHRGGETMLAGMQLADRFPSAPGPQELLAFVAAADGDLQGALNRWRRAAELDSGNPFVLLQAVRGKILEIGVELDPESHWPAEETRQVRAWIDRALQGNPRSEESMELLALIEANAKEFRIPAVNLLQNAVNRMKDPNPVLLALAVIRWRVKDYATARSIVGVVMEATRARPDTKAMAQMLQKRFAEETPKVAEPPRIATNNATASPPTSERTAAAPLPSPAQPRKVQPDDTLRLPLVRKKQVASTQRAPAVKVWRLGSEPARLMTQEECRKADREYVKATEGDAAARYAVAAAYGLGRGVAFDPDDAISWLKQANESGHGAAVELWQKAGGDPAAALKLLREREKGEMSADELPPLADDIASKIKVATERGENAPAQVAYRSVARYPDAHRKAGISGQGTVRCVIDETGRPRQISLRGFSAQEFGKATESSVRGWRFVPEIKDGKAEATTVEITLTYGDPAPVR